jgi:phosphoglycolate phosphatase
MKESPLTGQTLIFDLDGTLVDTAPDLVRALNAVLVPLGYRQTATEDVRGLIGHGARALLSRTIALSSETVSEARLDAFTTAFVDLYAADIAAHSLPFPGVRQALMACQQAGCTLAVCTNKKGYLARQLLEALDLAHFFSAIIGGDEVPAAKPDARAVQSVLDAVNGDSARAIFIGDSRTDAEAARNAGLPCLLVPFGYTIEPVGAMPNDGILESYDVLFEKVVQLIAARQGT